MKLTRAQEKLLRELPDLPSDGLRCTGSRKRTADTLRSKGLATVTAVQKLAHWYARTAEGAKQVQFWEKRWKRAEQLIRVSVSASHTVEHSKADSDILSWAMNMDIERYRELHARVKEEERNAYIKAIRGAL